MKKGDESRGDVLLQKLILGTGFQEGIRRIRQMFDVPKNGFIDMSSIGNWYSKRSDITKEETVAQKVFNAEVKRFLVDQALPVGVWWEHKIIEYVLSDGRIEFLWLPPAKEPFVEVINRPLPTNEGSYTDLRIYEGVTQRDLRAFMSRYWRMISPSYRKGTHKQIRRERNTSINNEAVAIYDLSKEERRLAAGTNDYMEITKELEVERILKGKGLAISGDAAKAVKYRRRKAKR
ncbi:MAG: hypothetical protein IPJ67_03150 [Candidatus Moraniibacteriota bacterium]|nr:MAG: hypothetical protein IPJ67_03150 [Candidatus Moranbacteria bacterium]